MLEKSLPAMKHPQILINHYLNKCKYICGGNCAEYVRYTLPNP